ncbi:hypothetical protein [Streptomyces sp900116325]|uniref:hypothetical protein n=1 Tax=Streptomyces sp. 900116325 TaxID=3154295 RepID=UPI00331F052A
MNGLPPGVPGSAAHDLALEALGSGFSTAFLICGIAAALAALGMIGVRPHRPQVVRRQVRAVQVRRERCYRLAQGDCADDDRAEREAEIAENVGRGARHARQLRGPVVQCDGRHRAHAHREADADQQIGQDEDARVGVGDIEPANLREAQKQMTRRLLLE